MKTLKNIIGIFLVFAICFSVCACNKKADTAAETTESTASQTSITNTAESETETETSTTSKADDAKTTSIKSHRPKTEISTTNQWVKATKSTTTTKRVKTTYSNTIDGYVTLADMQIPEPDSEPETKYVITDVKSNISGKISLSGMQLTIEVYLGALLYVNYTAKPSNKFYFNSDYTMQKLVNGQWTDMEQLREADEIRVYNLDRSEIYTYSLPTYYSLDKYFNNIENGRYKLIPNFFTDEEMKNSTGFEIEFTVTKQTVKEADILHKIENPVSAEFSLASYSTNYTYTLFDSRQVSRVSQLYNNLKLTPIEKPETYNLVYSLTVIDGNGYEHQLLISNGGAVVGKGSSYFFAENGIELYDYIDAIHMNI